MTATALATLVDCHPVMIEGMGDYDERDPYAVAIALTRNLHGHLRRRKVSRRLVLVTQGDPIAERGISAIGHHVMEQLGVERVLVVLDRHIDPSHAAAADRRGVTAELTFGELAVCLTDTELERLTASVDDKLSEKNLAREALGKSHLAPYYRDFALLQEVTKTAMRRVCGAISLAHTAAEISPFSVTSFFEVGLAQGLYEAADVVAFGVADPLEAVLAEADVSHLHAHLGAATLDSCIEHVRRDRPGFLAWLKEQGGSKVGERQRLANALGRTARLQQASEPPEPPSAQSPSAPCSVDRAPQYRDARAAIAAGDVAFVTLTNTGYLPYTLNCLHSLQLLGETLPLTAFCADDPSYEWLSRLAPPRTATASSAEALPQMPPPGIPPGARAPGPAPEPAPHATHGAAPQRLRVQAVAMHEEELGRFCEWKERGWARLMWLKCEAVRRSLATHAFVVFTDGDIVYERRGAIEHCVNALITSSAELVIQNDGLSDGLGVHGVCAGFMAIKATAQTARAFEVDPASLSPGWDDQKYLNDQIAAGRLRYSVLPLGLFPNGQYFTRHHADTLQRTRPFLVHFNWMTGHNKRAAMAEHNRWLLSDEETAAPPTRF